MKIGAGGKIEEDIDHLIEIGVDYIAIDGGQGAHSVHHPFYLMTREYRHCMQLCGLVNHLEKER